MPLYIELKKMKFKDPDLGLKVILMIHFLFTILAAMGSFCPVVYLFYNMCLILPLFWTIHSKSYKGFLKMAITMNMCSIIMDAVYIVLAFEGSRFMESRDTASAVFAIIHLIFRPFCILFLMKYDDQHRNTEGEQKDEILDNVKSTQTVLQNIHFDFPLMKQNKITII